MTKVKSLADLKAMREKLQSNLDIREKAENPESLVQIKVAMATCGIAAGAKQVMEHMMQKTTTAPMRFSPSTSRTANSSRASSP